MPQLVSNPCLYAAVKWSDSNDTILDNTSSFTTISCIEDRLLLSAYIFEEKGIKIKRKKRKNKDIKIMKEEEFLNKELYFNDFNNFNCFNKFKWIFFNLLLKDMNLFLAKIRELWR